MCLLAFATHGIVVCRFVSSPFGVTHATHARRGIAMTDLFGLEQTTKRTNDRPEAAALVEVLKAVKAHPLVAWAER